MYLINQQYNIQTLIEKSCVYIFWASFVINFIVLMIESERSFSLIFKRLKAQSTELVAQSS